MSGMLTKSVLEMACKRRVRRVIAGGGNPQVKLMLWST